jgi:hypothetical protein
MRVEPESGAVLTEMPSEATIVFDEVILERVAAQPGDIGGAVLLSPTTERVKVGWHRNRISVSPRGGFKPGRIYRLELLPVVSDLRNNRLKTHRVVVFSTGPEIPSGRLEGAVVDWVAGRPGASALIEADLMPDSLPYRALADSTGYFRMDAMPPGRYLVWGIMDSNSDRRLGGREAFDTLSLTLDSTSVADLYAMVHDTAAIRLRALESVDSLTLKLTFSQPLPFGLQVDTAQITVAPDADSTAKVEVVGFLTQVGLDSLIARERRAADSAAARADTAAHAALPAHARPGATPTPARAGQPTPRPASAARPPLDSTRAQKMLARRPPPSDTRFLRLAQPLTPDAHYLVILEGLESLTGARATARSGIRGPRPREAAAPATRRDSTTQRDSLPRRDSTARRDTTHLR